MGVLSAKLHKSQKGIAHLGLLLVVLGTLGAIGFVGYNVYQRNTSSASSVESKYVLSLNTKLGCELSGRTWDSKKKGSKACTTKCQKNQGTYKSASLLGGLLGGSANGYCTLAAHTSISKTDCVNTLHRLYLDGVGCARSTVATKANAAQCLAKVNASSPYKNYQTASSKEESCVAQPTKPKSGIKLMTYNVRGEVAKADHVKNEQAWSTRVGVIEKLIKRELPDVIAFQEADGDIDTFRSKIKKAGYTLLGEEAKKAEAKRSSGAKYYKHYSPRQIAWKTSKYTLVDSGYIMVARQNVNRGMPWVKLKIKATGKQFYVVNLHNDYRDSSDGERNRVAATKQILDLAKKKITKDTPVFIMGDFNSYYDDKITNMPDKLGTKPYKEVMQPDGTFETSIKLTSNRKGADCASFNKFQAGGICGRAEWHHIDHVYVQKNAGITVNSWRNLTDSLATTGSDHNPIIVDVSFSNDGSK